MGEFPSRAIVMWSGSTVPDGWALCDGSNGTPDLLDCFIRGSDLKNIGQTGGSTVHAHGTEPHYHNHGHGSIETDLGTVTSGPGERTVGLFRWGRHSHEVKFPPISSSRESPDTEETDHLPPFYQLAFIMKL
jgi:hypothetical protein